VARNGYGYFGGFNQFYGSWILGSSLYSMWSIVSMKNPLFIGTSESFKYMWGLFYRNNKELGDIQQAIEVDLNSVKTKVLPCIARVGNVALCDVTVVVIDKRTPLFQVKCSKYALCTNSTYYKKQMKTDFKQEDVIQHVLVDDETPESAFYFLNIMTSAGYEQEIKNLKEEELPFETLKGVVVRLGEVGEEEKQYDFFWSMMLDSESSVLALIDVAGRLLKQATPDHCRILHSRVYKKYSTGYQFMDNVIDGGKIIVLPQGVLELFIKSYSSGSPYFVSTAHLWILARMGEHHDIAEKLEPYLPPTFASHLYLCKDEPEQLWWHKYLGSNIVTKEQLNKSAIRIKKACTSKQVKREVKLTGYTITFENNSNWFQVVAGGLIWEISKKDKNVVVALEDGIADNLLYMKYTVKAMSKVKKLCIEEVDGKCVVQFIVPIDDDNVTEIKLQITGESVADIKGL